VPTSASGLMKKCHVRLTTAALNSNLRSPRPSYFHATLCSPVPSTHSLFVRHFFFLRIFFFNMRVRRRLSEKRDHDTAFGNLHRWTLIVAAPIKIKKFKKLKCAREQDCRDEHRSNPGSAVFLFFFKGITPSPFSLTFPMTHFKFLRREALPSVRLTLGTVGFSLIRLPTFGSLILTRTSRFWTKWEICHRANH